MLARMTTTAGASAESRWQRAARWALAAVMISAGVGHFVAPEGFVAIVPSWLPSPRALVAISGVCELAGGLGLLVPSLRRAAAFGLMLLFIAVFPANVNMALRHIQPPGVVLSEWLLFARLPFQAVLIAWAWWLTKRREPSADR
ncbi:MAG: hypothetical protein JWN44_854 [Myxococcales bacterium]|nr:hypothetical protein [Myxococcales bacterium]